MSIDAIAVLPGKATFTGEPIEEGWLDVPKNGTAATPLVQVAALRLLSNESSQLLAR